MCGTGFSVSRPARLAVSSPNQSATTPWLISWRMTATTRQPKKIERLFGDRRSDDGVGQRRCDAQVMQRRAAGIASSRASPISLAAATRMRRRCRASNFASASSISVQGLGELAGERVDLAPLGRHLARVGEALVEVERRIGAVTELAELVAQAVALLLELARSTASVVSAMARVLLPCVADRRRVLDARLDLPGTGGAAAS